VLQVRALGDCSSLMKQRNFYGVSICNSAAQSSGIVQVCGETMLTDVHGRVAVRVLAHYVNASLDLRGTDACELMRLLETDSDTDPRISARRMPRRLHV